MTVGFFDGVHLGHRSVIDTTVARARDRGIRSVAITFDRHPREILTPGSEPRLLTTVDRKAALIEASGLDVLVVLRFTPEFSRIPAEDFVRTVLVGGVHARHAAMGANFTFGFKAAGTVATLPEMGAPFGLTAEGCRCSSSMDGTVSSSSIRDALSAGDLTWPLEALGRRFVLDGEVISGHGRGKGLGYPTANLRTWPRLLLPGQGIYAGVAEVDGLGTGRRSTSARTPRSAWSRCTSRRSCSTSRGTSCGRAARDRVLGASARRDPVRLDRRADRGDRRRRRTHARDRARRSLVGARGSATVDPPAAGATPAAIM